jgi:electron transfer flavoprotein beta subunit
MNVAVLLSMVPDLVEELEISEAGTALETQWMRWVLSESDEHALEQALLLKDRHGARVTVLAVGSGDAEEALFSSLAKGADEAVTLTGVSPGLSKRALATAFKEALQATRSDLILTGVYAIDDLDGHVAGLLAAKLGLPFVGVTRRVTPGEAGRVLVHKEYPGGLAAEMEVALPAVIGVLSAPQPPRYVPVARIRETRKNRTLTERAVTEAAPPGGLVIRRLYKPEPSERATMLDGSPDEVAGRILAILQDRGLAR